MISPSLPVDEPPQHADSSSRADVAAPADLQAAYQFLISRREPSYLTDLTLELLHKFNNRMTGVVFNVDEAAQSVKDNEQLQKRMEKVRSTLLDSLQLINTIGRLHFQQHTGDPTYYSLQRVIKSALPLLAMLLPKGAAIHFQPASEQVCFYGRTGAVEEILLHLFSNAGKAIPDLDGSATIEIGGDLEDEHAKSWVVVRDNGPGIPSEIIPRLFAPLATHRAGQGHAGLGLYRARELAWEMGGDLVGKNLPQGGAEFRLTLPQSNPEPLA